MAENKFKTDLIKEIKERLPGAKVFHLDPNTDGQGIPDLLVLYKDRWGALEGKDHKGAGYRTNQEFYVNEMNEMSFAATIYPENKEEILDELQRALQRKGRRPRIPRSK